MADIPIILTIAGRTNTTPAALRAALVASVAATNPGYTANLPASLVEDIVSTDVGALVVMDQNLTDQINNVTPYGANAYVLNQQGQLVGVQSGSATNTSVLIVFTGTIGFVIAVGFTVSDGTYQYTVQDGGIIASSGSSASLFCVATQAGIWAVPANTVTTLVTSVPSTIALTCTNPITGTPSAGTETEENYRARVFRAYTLSSAQGFATYLKTLLANVSGVQARLVSVRQQPSLGWEVICGGGDPYLVSYAIYKALFDINTLVASVISVVGITNASPGVATTDLNHGLITGQTGVYIKGVVGMALTGGPYTVTVITGKTFSFGVDTTALGAWTSGGVVTPNNRNIAPSLIDVPDVYSVPYVLPPQQTVAISLTWNTTAPNSVSPAAVAQLGAVGLAAYVNSISVGQPINLFDLQTTFQAAVSSLIPIQYLTRMVFSVSINGVGTAPLSGTGIIAGDPESYFLTTTAGITIAQG
jgi:hypothetical protein